MTLTVGINLLSLVPGVVGGSEGYATSLLAPLVKREPCNVRSAQCSNWYIGGVVI